MPTQPETFCELIGGPRDGDIIAIPTNWLTVNFAIPQPVTLEWPCIDTPSVREINVHTYHRGYYDRMIYDCMRP